MIIDCIGRAGSADGSSRRQRVCEYRDEEYLIDPCWDNEVYTGGSKGGVLPSWYEALEIIDSSLGSKSLRIGCQSIKSLLLDKDKNTVVIELRVPPLFTEASDNVWNSRISLSLIWTKANPRQWHVEGDHNNMPWFETPRRSDNPDFYGNFNGWFIRGDNSGGPRLELKSNFPFNDLKVCSVDNKFARFKKANAGLFSVNDGTIQKLCFVLIPNVFGNKAGSVNGLDLQGLQNNLLDGGQNRKNRYSAPFIHFCDLGGKGLSAGLWRSMLLWRYPGKRTEYQDETDLNYLYLLDTVWNPTVRLGMAGRRLSSHGLPWLPLPITEAADKSQLPPEPIFLFEHDAAPNPRLRGLFFHKRNNERDDFKVSFRFPWQSMPTVPVKSGRIPDEAIESLKQKSVRLEGKLKIRRGEWGKPLSSADNSPILPPPNNKERGVALYLDAAYSDILSKSEDDAYFEWQINDLKVTDGHDAWLNLGAMDVKLSGTTPDDKSSASFRVLANWYELECDAFLELGMQHVPCELRYSAATDSRPEQLSAEFDSAGPVERELHAEYGAMMVPGMGGNSKDKGIFDGRLGLRVLTARGKNATVEVSVDRELSDKGSVSPTFILQPRPFSVANVDSPELGQSQAGKHLGYWRSDDPEGPQWRIAASTVSFSFPPQAVGEEMERGVRFWDSTAASYIDPEYPVRYRFSGPTRITVRPGVVDRRYNAAPNNLGRILDRARLESFSTEMVYPLRMEFRRNARNEPDIHIAETQTFLGRTAPNLPVYINRGEDCGSDNENTENVSLINDVFPNDMADWLNADCGRAGDVLEQYRQLRARHSAMRANYAARLARFHVFDPMKADRQLELLEGLRFTIRSTREGAPALQSPLPVHVPDRDVKDKIQWKHDPVDLTPDQKAEISGFLANKGPKEKPEYGWDTSAASLRAGLVHTIEFPSELMAVLRNPVSEAGMVESLSFSALGATGTVSASFDSGLTRFIAEVRDGQLQTLTKIRLGRVCMLWNRARHVIVYSRSVVPSIQFADQQNSTPHSLGWPLLRKAEEYIEPVERLRLFQNEVEADKNHCGFMLGSEFAEPRIYVDGAWGRDLGHGYEVPLWDSRDTSGFYKKPCIALLSVGGESARTRQWCKDPNEIAFYSNTQGIGSDSDRWPSFAGVDAPQGPSRMPVLNHHEVNWDRALDGETARPVRGSAVRRERFDLRVESEGAANLQAGRGETEMLAALDVVSMARTDETAPPPDDGNTENKQFHDELHKVGHWGDSAAQIDQIVDEVRQFARRIPEQVLRHPCRHAGDGLKAEIRRVFTRAQQQIEKLNLAESLNGQAFPSIKDAVKEELARLQPLRRKMLQMALKPLNDALADLLRGAMEASKESRGVVTSLWLPVRAKLEGAVEGLARSCAGLKAVQDKALALNSGIMDAIEKLDAAEGTTKEKIENARKVLVEVQKKLNGFRDPRFAAQARMLRRFVDNAVAMCDRAISADSDPEKFKNKINECLDKTRALLTEIAGKAGILSDICANKLVLIDSEVARVNRGIEVFGEKPKEELLAEVRKLTGTLARLEETYGENVLEDLASEITSAAETIDSAVNAAAQSAIQSMIDLQESTKAHAGKVLNELKAKVLIAVDDIAGELCDELDQVREKITEELKNGEKALRKALADGVDELLDEGAKQKLKDLTEQFESFGGKVGAGIKLTKSIGELPKLPHLEFNADRAEYVFEDLEKQIKTSPFVAKLKEVDAGLKELGLAVPCQSLQDQLQPHIEAGKHQFSKIFRNCGGCDFEHMLKKLRLPQLNDDNIKVTHGIDKKTRTAWVNSSVFYKHAREEAMLEMGSFGVYIAQMSLNAKSSFSQSLNGQRKESTNAVLRGDWSLQFGGARLVTFRDVSLRYDGEDLDFDINPDKVELHPSLKFVSEIAEKLTDQIPPAIEIVKDTRGVPVGAKANMATVVPNPPPLGPVTIGPLSIVGGLSLDVAEQFTLGAHASIGTQNAPIFVQISWLGGGAWLESRVRLVGGEPQYSASMGLALGSMRMLTIGSVATARYSILLYARIEVDNRGGALTAGLQLLGSARIAGVATAYLRLLLEVTHKTGGGTVGTGMLDVRVKICWCCTLKIKKNVKRNI